MVLIIIQHFGVGAGFSIFAQADLDKSGWLPLYRFFLINGNINVNVVNFCRIITECWQQAWLPGNNLVVDESVYEFLGESPCHVYIPRKPHPNGLMSYGLSGYTAELRMPMLVDLEPWVPTNKLSARDAAKALVDRLCKFHGDALHPPHIIMDSAFGSFSDASEYYSKGVVVTMSIAENKKAWLWDMLTYDCPLDSGRVALVPMDGANQFLLASAYHVKTDSDKIVDIRTITTAFRWTRPIELEPMVLRLGQRRTHATGFFEYETFWADGDITWQQARSFMDDDGTFTDIWLENAAFEDIEDALGDLAAAALINICEAKSWKARFLYIMLIYLISLFRKPGPKRS